jgi:Icc-related predicted phosphoesterase
VHFVGLDSEVDLHSQAEWLEQDLSDNRLPWVVVMVHRPPYSSGAHGSTMVVREAFSPIFEAHGVQLVLAGHEHDYERSVPIEGTTYVVTGGGGRGTRDVGHSSFTAYSEAVAHFIYVTVDGADMRLYAVDGTGETFDFAHIVEPDAT